MNPKSKYFIFKAIRLGILCAGLIVVVLAGRSVITVNRPVANSNPKATEPGNQPADRVNINTATLRELMDLPTIGQVIGNRIIDYRQQHGPFKHASDIIIIKGISEHKFRQLEDLITVE